MAASNWFGDLQLAYKYIVVFCALLVLVFVAGLIKVFFDRRKLKKITKTEELEAGPKEDTVELNQREKDEGDLFGIRAIEAGFYAGVAQSRPTSRAGSVHGHPAMSSSTLVGGANSPLMKGHSNNNSVLSLNLGQTHSKLRPSEAELTGKHGAVDMSLQVPPSPGHPRGQSLSFGGSDSDSSDDFNTPRSMSPRSADFNHQHYAPAPQVAMPDALQVTYHGHDNHAQSQAASFNSSPGQSPTPPSPGNPPAVRLPTLPGTALRKDSRSPSPESYRPRVRAEHSTTEPAQSSTAPALEPIPTNAPASAPQPAPVPVTITMPAPTPTHKRRESDASSTYSQNRLSTFDSYQAYHQQASGRGTSVAWSDTYDYSLSSTDESRGTSMVLSVDHAASEGGRRSESSNHHLGLPPTQHGQESRLSEFYDAYYRDSQVGAIQVLDAKRIVGRHSTIVEVDTPLASPMFPKTMQSSQPGAAF